MSKRKRSRKTATVAREWTAVERAFFDAAPPEESEAPAPSPRPSGSREPLSPPRASTKRSWVLEGTARALQGRSIWIVVAVVSVVVGLSAAVFASRSAGHGRHGVAEVSRPPRS